MEKHRETVTKINTVACFGRIMDSKFFTLNLKLVLFFDIVMDIDNIVFF